MAWGNAKLFVGERLPGRRPWAATDDLYFLNSEICDHCACRAPMMLMPTIANYLRCRGRNWADGGVAACKKPAMLVLSLP